MTHSSGIVIIIPDKTTISVVSWYQMDPTDPVCRPTGHPACIGDPAYRLFETRLLFEARLVLEVLR